MRVYHSTLCEHMPSPAKNNTFQKKFAEFRHALSFIDALPQLTLLGFLIGIITGGIIVLFRLLLNLPLSYLLPGHEENFEGLSMMERGLLVAGGMLFLTVFLSFFKGKDRELSISHVLDRAHNHQGKLPFKNWCAQFVGATAALGTGQSVGREGPVVHLGAGAASFLGQWMRLPNNSTQTLIGCGVAAAISASFDTPLAGAIFAMEILMLEYTVVGFVPIILSSVMGAIISKSVLGDSGFGSTSVTTIGSLYEIPIMALVGFTIALCGGAYVKLNIAALRWNKTPFALRMLVATMIMVSAAIFVPETMGQGYDTITQAMEGNIVLHSLALIALVKLVVTPLIVGLGVPGGLIGPLLVVGACVGGVFGLVIAHVFPELGANPSFYVFMGMVGMMSAVLNAPLTALVTVLELSYNPNIIFPAMLVIVFASVSTRQIFKIKSIFFEQLRNSNRQLDFGPTKQLLMRTGVRSVMDTRTAICKQTMNLEEASKILQSRPMWLVIQDENALYKHAMRAADLANYLNDNEDLPADEPVNLTEIPSRMYELGAVDESATLYEAMKTLSHTSAEVLYIAGRTGIHANDVRGILTLSSIENYYKPTELRNANTVG